MNNLEWLVQVVILVLTIFGASFLASIHIRFETIRCEIATLRAEIQAGQNNLRGDISAHRAETRHLSEKVERIDRQMDAFFKPVFPGSGK